MWGAAEGRAPHACRNPVGRRGGAGTPGPSEPFVSAAAGSQGRGVNLGGDPGRSRASPGDQPRTMSGAQRRTMWSSPGLQPRDRPGKEVPCGVMAAMWSSPGLQPRDRPGKEVPCGVMAATWSSPGLQPRDRPGSSVGPPRTMIRGSPRQPSAPCDHHDDPHPAPSTPHSAPSTQHPAPRTRQPDIRRVGSTPKVNGR